MENEKNSNKFSRRNILKGMAAASIVGVAAWEADYFLRRRKNEPKKGLPFQFNEPEEPNIDRSEIINIGIIGSGGRCNYLMESLGFLTPEHVQGFKDRKKNNPKDTRYETFMEQPDLGVRIKAVCDVFDVNAERGIRAGSNLHRVAEGEKLGPAPKRYRTYIELLDDPEIDAVVIATPDHWHGTMSIEAAKRGKHVYVEKPITWQLDETYEVRNAVKESGIKFQLGHQNRQTDSNIRAAQLVEQGALGNITLMETTTNRNSPNGAWVYGIHPKASPETIDWKQFLGPAPHHEFSKERFFRWRCWWDYSTGLIGDLFTHEFDVFNQVIKAGIPGSATASGGIYHFKDGRTVPDVIQIALEFPEKECTMLYSASLANSLYRGKTIMGSDASMKLGGSLEFFVDGNSSKYREQMKKGEVHPGEAAYIYDTSKGIDGISTATERYFAKRGLLTTARKGKNYSTTFLHLREWLDAIRTDGDTSCNIDRGFEEGIATHMASIAFREGRTTHWDKDNEKIV